MAYVWHNPYGFSVAWIGVMIYFTVAMAYLVLTIWKETKRWKWTLIGALMPLGIAFLVTFIVAQGWRLIAAGP